MCETCEVIAVVIALLYCLCKGEIDAADCLIDLIGGFEADDGGIHQARLHRKAYGLLAVRRTCEIAFSHYLHTDDAVPLLSHYGELFENSRDVGGIAASVPAFGGGIEVQTLRVDPNEVDIDPIELRGFSQRG